MRFDKIRYNFQQFIARGGVSIFTSLFVAFLAILAVTFLIRLIVFWIMGDAGAQYGGRHFWATWTQLTDPGNMFYDLDSGWATKLVSVLTGMAGIIIFSALIAFITTALDAMISEFRQGRGKVIESGHTLVLGWSDQVPELIKELILANESEKSAAVVILANKPKEEMDALLYKALPNRKTTKIVTTQGSPTSGTELRRAALATARSVVVLSDCVATADAKAREQADILVLKTVMAILACQETENQIPIITQVHTSEKQILIEGFGDEQIIALDIEAIMSQLITQTSLTSGLQVVYNEMFSFDGGEIYFVDDHDSAGTRFGDLPTLMPDGIPMGLWSEDGGLRLRPGPDTIVGEDEELIIFAEDDSTISFVKEPICTQSVIATPAEPMEKKRQRTLIVGWNPMGKTFVVENSEYLKPGSEFTIVVPSHNDVLDRDVAELNGEYDELTISIQISDTLDPAKLAVLEPYSYDVIFILNVDPDEIDAERIDAGVLITLHLLRSLGQSTATDTSSTRVVTQVLNPDNQELMTQSRADDFIISDKMTTMIMAQMSEEPRMRMVYDDLFQEDGSEIYLKPASLYLGDSQSVTTTFADVLATADERDEICLGYRLADKMRDADANFGVTLNPKKDIEITLCRDDFLVVLSEDEL